jgi:hypothetical protein
VFGSETFVPNLRRAAGGNGLLDLDYPDSDLVELLSRA